jgi:serine/threonine-protein kinase
MRPTPLELRAQKRIGTILGEKYTLSGVLGVGGMAVVYLATHRNGNRVAIKVLHRELSLDPGLVARFAREGYVANAIDHRGAVRVLDDDVDADGSAFLVMELLLGETLDARAKRSGGRLPQREVVALAHQLLDVLAAAHAKGVVHRDIKPENLFLTRERELKVLDFGIARLRDDGNAPGTAAGMRIGTPAFMPPEQALGRTEEVDARSDVWAVGATLFTLLSGRLVHEAESASEIVVRAATQPCPPLASVAGDVPPELAAVVDRALSFRREARFPDARAMQEALESANLALYAEPVSASAVGPVPADRASASTKITDESALRETAPYVTDPITGEAVDAPGHATRAARATVADETQASRATMETPPPVSPIVRPSAQPPAASERGSPPTPEATAKARGPRRAIVAIAMVAAATIAAIAATRGPGGRVDGAPSASASGAAAAARGCTSNAACAVDAGGKATICRKDTGSCVALEAPGCRVLASPQSLASDDTVWFGAMFPQTGPERDTYGVPAIEAVDLGRRDFEETVAGLPPARPGGPRRPIALVACDDAEQPARVAAHLVDGVGVPAILGFARSKEVLDLAESLFIPRGVLALATNTATMLSSIPHAPGKPRLVWRTTTSSAMTIAAEVAVLAQLVEPELRAAPGLLAPGEPIRVALVRVDNATGLGSADRYVASVRFNDRSVAENGAAFRSFVVPDHLDADHPLERARMAAEVSAFAPHVIFDALDDAYVIDAVEPAWPAGARFRPRYIRGTLGASELIAAIEAQPELRRRVFGVETRSDTAVLAKFVMRHNEVFASKIRPESATSAQYDSFYLLAYAAAALGEKPLTGLELAGAIGRLLPPGAPVEVGPAGIYGALSTLGAGKNIDLDGTITTLDFDRETGDPTASFSVYCIALGGAGGARARAVASGLNFDATTRRLTGTLRCP